MSRTIYAIQNRVNKKNYIGTSDNPKSRLQNHLSNLKRGKHPVEDMQEDFNKYGDVFDLFIIEENVGFADEYIEYKYMHKYRSCEREYGYNYKDHIAKRIVFGKPRKLACGTEADIIIPFDTLKTEYIKSIVEELNSAEDIELLDFVYQYIRKHKAATERK